MTLVEIKSLEETIALATALAKIARRGDVITLQGDLGAGKSAFARAFIKAIVGQETVVPSPTFTILESYEGPDYMLSHMDLYRLESPEELQEIGFDEALIHGVCLIEWPERLHGYPLPQLLAIHITANPKNENREFRLEVDGSWVDRLKDVPLISED